MPEGFGYKVSPRKKMAMGKMSGEMPMKGMMKTSKTSAKKSTTSTGSKKKKKPY